MTSTTVKEEVYIIRNRKQEEKKQKTHIIEECVLVVLVCHRDILLKVLRANGLHHLVLSLQYDLPDLQGIPLSCRSSLPILHHRCICRNGDLLLNPIKQEMRGAEIAKIWKSTKRKKKKTYPEQKANEHIQRHCIPSLLQTLGFQIGLELLLGQQPLEVL